ncbi:acetyl-CoA carboxylase, carboxyltransferase subunit beta [Paractinoplanes toevensis]|uniref:Acetyl-coenzyme A carboxylase carboxyl transferase subunit beta n=1 Tax=Paractinoplanes toevensis TaxID=571911 RepID=A0A919TEI3_9ACTN|nr:acetyl-CoA carboxylase, carboxyltransferase subunit beta [Actinoplanes toevensis]GIM92606.1 hypothetical protein Ato02nite_043990 [Actinoplanes toevensis]
MTVTDRPTRRWISRFGGNDDSWVRCGGCHHSIYQRRLERNTMVCPECGHHFRLTVRQRLDTLLDPGSFARFGADVAAHDVLRFHDTKPYSQRLAESRRRTGNQAAVVCGTGAIEDHPVVVAILDFGFLGGSIGTAGGELICMAAREALRRRLPLLILAASGGARMQEGVLSLMQLARTSQELARLHEAGILVININTDPTYGGSTASFASLGDLIIAEPGARIGFAGPAVISQTIHQALPASFQTAEYLHRNGQIDMVVPREALRPTLGRLLRMHATSVPVPATGQSDTVLITDAARLSHRTASDVVARARDTARPTTLDHCAGMLEDFVELHGDRLGGGDDPAIVGGLGRLADRTVVVIGHQKGHDIAELTRRNFGMPQPWGYHKALRLMEYAARFGFPLVTLVDTPGAYPGVEAEQRGQSYAIARCIQRMTTLPVPVVTVVTGEGGSGGALALAAGDRLLIMENAYLSVISPEGCSTILFGDASSAARAAGLLGLTPADLLAARLVDGVIPETGESTGPTLRAAVIAALDDLAGLGPAELRDARYRRIAAFDGGLGTR